MEEKNQEKKKKMSFWRKAFISIKDFEKYQDFAIEPIRTTIIYILQLVAVFVIVICLGFTYQFGVTINQAVSYFKTDIPDLTFENNTLRIEQTEPIILQDFEQFSGAVILDTVSDQETINKEIENVKNYENCILILKDKVILKNAMTNMFATYQYEDFSKQYNVPQAFDKQDIVNYIESVNPITIYVSIFCLMFIYMFTIYLASAILDSLILGVLAFLTARISRLRLRYSSSFNMAVHALTLPILLNAIYIVINVVTGFEIKYFQIMYTAISYIYIITAILIMKSDLIRQQIELTKIIEEQQKIKEEMERKKQEEEEERRREEQKKKEEEKKKKEKERENPEEDGLNPEGNEA